MLKNLYNTLKISTFVEQFKNNSIMNNKKMELAPWLPTMNEVKIYMSKNEYKYIVLIDDGTMYVGFRPFRTLPMALDYAGQMQKNNSTSSVSTIDNL